jgi:DNA repair protein RecO (recombination protein O)
MIHRTKGIVLRNIKYGETSIIATVFTEAFGVQSYLVNGVRSSSKKGSNKASLFQPASLLELEAYHNEFKNLQRLKEYKWNYLYRHIFSDVIKNTVALFMIELTGKCLKQPEAQPELFSFIEDALIHLDDAGQAVTANFPIFFAVQIATFLGFNIGDSFSPEKGYLDLHEGKFSAEQPRHSYFIEGPEAEAISEILRVMKPEELEEIPLNQEMRRKIIHALEQFYTLHVPEFGTMKTLPVLKDLMS